MTLRTRLVAVAAVAVVTAVLAASAASYVAARNALLDSIDGTLRTTAATIAAHSGRLEQGLASQIGFQYVTPNGIVLDGGHLPVTSAVEAVAAGRSSSFIADVTVHGQDDREFVESLGTVRVTTPRGLVVVSTSSAALQVVLPLSAVNGQLGHLGIVLSGVAFAGIAVALLLAWLVGRMALVPLHDLAASVEEVADTTDMTLRLDPGGSDELGQLRRAFNHLLAALERSDAAQRQLVLDAGHELRTPLTSLRTNFEVIRRLDELSPADRTVLVDDVLTQLGELTDLVGDLSELARGDHSVSQPTLTRLDRLVEDAVAVASTHARSRDVRYEVHTEPTLVMVRRDRVMRAVGNLLDNARKWSPEGGTVDVTCLGGTVTVRDRGPGITPEDLPHVFDRFYRAATARSLPGSGLGLSIVAQVVESEGGSVTAGVAVDGGAVMRLALPLVSERGDPLVPRAPALGAPALGAPALGAPALGAGAPEHAVSLAPDSPRDATSDVPEDQPASDEAINSMRLPKGSST